MLVASWPVDGLVVLLPEAVTFFFARVAEVELTGTAVPSSGVSFMIVMVAIVAALASCFGWKVIITEPYRWWRRDGWAAHSLPTAVRTNQLFCKSDAKLKQFLFLVVRVGLPQNVGICDSQVE